MREPDDFLVEGGDDLDQDHLSPPMAQNHMRSAGAFGLSVPASGAPLTNSFGGDIKLTINGGVGLAVNAGLDLLHLNLVLLLGGTFDIPAGQVFEIIYVLPPTSITVQLL